jgi:hypothetical protein
MNKPFVLEQSDKDLLISGPYEFSMAVDFDDVDHELILDCAEKVVKILNKYWKKYE